MIVHGGEDVEPVLEVGIRGVNQSTFDELDLVYSRRSFALPEGLGLCRVEDFELVRGFRRNYFPRLLSALTEILKFPNPS